jgi:addiction module HigA family antidote
MKKKTINSMTNRKDDDGLVGNPRGADSRSEGFQKLKMTIHDRAAALTPEERRQIELRAVRYRMQEYLEESSQAVIPAGYFINECLQATGVKLKSFASYLKSNSGNVSKIIKGSRKINPETAIILGNTFETEPELWLQIQDKNEIIELKRMNKGNFLSYTLDKLIEVQVKTKVKHI